MPQDLIAPGRLIVGRNVRDGLAFVARFVSSGTGAESYIRFESYDNVGQPNLTIGRARGTAEAPAIVQAGDILGELEFFGYTNQWHHCAEVASVVCGAPAAGVIPDSDLQFKTTNAGGLDTIRVRIMPNGTVAVGTAATQTEAVIAAQAPATLWVAHNDGTIPFGVTRAETAAGGPSQLFRKSRGTIAAPATVAVNDELAYLQAGAYTNAWHDNLGAIAIYTDAAIVAGQRPASRIAFRTQPNNAGGPSDRMVIYSGGAVVVGPGTADTTRILHVVSPTTSFSIVRFQSTGGGATNNVLRLDGGDNAVTGSAFLAFHRPDGTEIGSVKQNAAGTVAYNTSSDERLKADILETDMGLATVMQIQARRFRYKTDPSNRVYHGFIAQELDAIFPEAVTQGGAAKACNCPLVEKGMHDPDCFNANPWGVDYGKLTPLLVRAVQELAGRVAVLEKP